MTCKQRSDIRGDGLPIITFWLNTRQGAKRESMVRLPRLGNTQRELTKGFCTWESSSINELK